MYTNTESIFFIFEYLLVSLVISTIMSWIGIKLVRQFSLFDRPGSAPHKQHDRPIPIAGAPRCCSPFCAAAGCSAFSTTPNCAPA
ncbi:MAG: hypothetical protein M5U05_06780 [Anaerolineales bacterium]|nr:hypothetical protein [Anaerolineales bacterium]